MLASRILKGSCLNRRTYVLEPGFIIAPVDIEIRPLLKQSSPRRRHRQYLGDISFGQLTCANSLTDRGAGADAQAKKAARRLPFEAIMPTAGMSGERHMLQAACSARRGSCQSLRMKWQV
jgi:hypothetical protein